MTLLVSGDIILRQWVGGNVPGKMVGATGFEPATSCSQSKRSTRLSYAPTAGFPSQTYFARLKVKGKLIRQIHGLIWSDPTEPA